MTLDLFGQQITTAPPMVPNGEKKRHKTKANGYPCPPGSGPGGETCKTCKHYARLDYHAKTYRKCLVIRDRWTHGPGTDIKASSPACLLWERETKEN